MAFTFPDIDPVAFSIGPVDIRWYALSYVAGFLLGWWYSVYMLKSAPDGYRPTRKELDDFIPWAVIGVILGGRRIIKKFYNADFYFSNPVNILKVWQGGMAFHGGLIGAAVSMYAFSRLNEFKFLQMADVVACAAPIGLFFGRIANFINGELIGRHAPDLSWGIIFPYAGVVPRHPSQLYEAALEGLLIFLVLFALARFTSLRQTPGMIAGIFLVLYSAARSFAEIYREPDAHIGFLMGGMTMGQLLCIPMAIVGIGTIIYARHAANAKSA